MTIQQFVSKFKIRIKSEMTDRNPLNDDWKDADHYKVTLYRIDNVGKKRQVTTHYSKGYGHKGKEPGVHEVLSCLASDAQSGKEDFEDFCANLGYDSDSRSAHKIWKNCKKYIVKLEKFLGGVTTHQLLYEVEPY